MRVMARHNMTNKKIKTTRKMRTMMTMITMRIMRTMLTMLTIMTILDKISMNISGGIGARDAYVKVTE